MMSRSLDTLSYRMTLPSLAELKFAINTVIELPKMIPSRICSDDQFGFNSNTSQSLYPRQQR